MRAKPLLHLQLDTRSRYAIRLGPPNHELDGKSSKRTSRPEPPMNRTAGRAGGEIGTQGGSPSPQPPWWGNRDTRAWAGAWARWWGNRDTKGGVSTRWEPPTGGCGRGARWWGIWDTMPRPRGRSLPRANGRSGGRSPRGPPPARAPDRFGLVADPLGPASQSHYALTVGAGQGESSVGSAFLRQGCNHGWCTFGPR